MPKSKKSLEAYVPTAHILPILEDKFPKDRPDGKVFGKVEGHLNDYAESLGTTTRKLMVGDVYDQKGEIHPKLLRYVESIPRLPKQTVKRWRNYQSEIRANLRNLSGKLYDRKREKVDDGSKTTILLDRVPEALRVILPYLPREGSPNMDATEKRLKAPLKDNGIIMLTGLLNIWERYNLGTCDEVFIDHFLDLNQELKELSPSARIGVLLRLAKKIRKKLGLSKPKAESKALRLESWPRTLRREWEVFEQVAKHGPGTALKLEAKEAKFSVKKIVSRTIDDYRDGLGYALWVIKPEGDLSVLDLIKVVPHEGSEPGDDNPKEHNHLIDLFRAHEREKKGRRKGVGFDSVFFKQFHSAIRAIAARNGYGRHIKMFAEAYRVCVNEEAKENHKNTKKEGIPIKWVDGQIAKLNVRFLQIVKTGSFKHTPGRSIQSRSDVVLVMFFVWLVTLRYMGYRQQCLVNCVVGENFILNRDGSILLRFNKTKNRKRIRMELNESRRWSHGLLWDTLTLYYKKVYPNLVKQSGNTLDGQLFVATTKRTSFRPFKHYKDFYDLFIRGRNRFMDVDDLDESVRHSFHPHFLRGLCTDWMVLVLKMTCVEAAEVLGISPIVLEREYLSQDREHDAGQMFDNVYARRRAEQLEGEFMTRVNDTLEKVTKTQGKILEEKEQEILRLRAENEMLRSRLGVSPLAVI
jgi:hypothetical protein